MKELQLGTKGVVITGLIVTETGAAADLTGAVPEFRFEGPKGVEIDVTGVVLGAPTDGKVGYELQDADGVAEIAGTWKWQVYLELASGWKGWSPQAAFTVLHNLGA